MYELLFNLTDATLKGTSNSVEPMAEVISKYQVTFNNFKLKEDAYNACKANKICGENVDASDSEILNYMYRRAYQTIANTPLTN